MNKNITNKIKYVSVLALAIFLFFGAKPLFAQDCWSNYGPYWMNCSDGSNSNNNGDDDDDNGNNNSDNLEVSTLSATNIDSDSATLRGDIISLDESEDYERFFEWGTSSGNLNHTASVSGTTDNEGSFSKTITGLNEDDQYYYRACVESQDSNDDDCGSIRSFTTDDNSGSNNNDDDDDNDDDSSDSLSADVITAAATGISSYAATLNGLVINDGGSQTVWFEWGTTTSLGHRTPSRLVSGDRNFVSAQINGLTPGQAYFFRIFSSNGDRGVYESFIATSVSGGGSNNNSGGNGSSGGNGGQNVIVTNSGEFLKVGLRASTEDVTAGEPVSIAVVYENLTNVSIKNIKIAVDFPEGMSVLKIEAGKKVSDRKIEATIPELAPKTQGSFVVEAMAGKEIKKGEFLVVIVEATHTNPAKPGETVSTSDYLVLKAGKGGIGQSANVFSAGFLPHTFLGWLIIVILIAFIIYFARKMQKEHHDKKNHLKIAK